MGTPALQTKRISTPSGSISSVLKRCLVCEFCDEFELPGLGFADDDVMEQVDGEGARTDEVDDSGGNPVRLDECAEPRSAAVLIQDGDSHYPSPYNRDH